MLYCIIKFTESGILIIIFRHDLKMSHDSKNESKIKVLPAAIFFLFKTSYFTQCPTKLPKIWWQIYWKCWNLAWNGRGSGVGTSFPAFCWMLWLFYLVFSILPTDISVKVTDCQKNFIIFVDYRHEKCIIKFINGFLIFILTIYSCTPYNTRKIEMFRVFSDSDDEWDLMSSLNIWAATWDFQQCDMCNQQSLRSACSYAQSDQSLC